MQTVIERLRSLRDKTRHSWDVASQHLKKRRSRRNILAEQAATDHRNRASDLLDTYQSSGNAAHLKAQLRDCRSHADKWARKFQEWARKHGHHDHDYAAYVHFEAAGW